MSCNCLKIQNNKILFIFATKLIQCTTHIGWLISALMMYENIITIRVINHLENCVIEVSSIIQWK